jgi:hypothetical protein
MANTPMESMTLLGADLESLQTFSVVEEIRSAPRFRSAQYCVSPAETELHGMQRNFACGSTYGSHSSYRGGNRRFAGVPHQRRLRRGRRQFERNTSQSDWDI